MHNGYDWGITETVHVSKNDATLVLQGLVYGLHHYSTMNLKTLPFLIFALNSSLFLSAQPGIYGQWNTGRGGIVEIYECGNELCGKLVDSNEPDRIDVNNPDPTKSNEKLIGHNILKGFEHISEGVWKKGKIYNPNNGKLYSAKLTLDGKQLKVRGFKGISLFGKTVIWSRAK